MLDFEEYRELRNGKRYYTSIERTMSDHGSLGENLTGNSSEDVEEEVSEIQMLTEEMVNEQVRGFMAPLTRQLEELTRLVQGMVTTQHLDDYPRTDFGTTSGTATYQSDRALDCFSLLLCICSHTIMNMPICIETFPYLLDCSIEKEEI